MEITVEDWFRQLPHDEDTPKPEEEVTLKDFLSGRISAETAAERFTSIVAKAPDPFKEVVTLWAFVHDAAEDIPSIQEKLTGELLKAIQRLPDVERDGKVLVYDNLYKLWSDLPKLDHDLCSDTGPSNLDRPAKQSKWINLNSFAARLTSHNILHWKIFGTSLLQKTLEEEPWNSTSELETIDERKREDILHGRNIHVLDVLVPAAAQYIFHAGQLYFELKSGSGPEAASGRDQANPDDGHPQWGLKDIPRERWDFWKARFGWVQRQTELEEDARAVAGEAVVAMERIESDA